ncbi:MAG: hypothetical protein ACJAVI_001210 [Candidatus Azotimanducaceae bacterium]
MERGDGNQLAMERIFYFSGYRMTVFDWNEKTLISSRDFQPDEEGYADFEYLLAQSVTMPAKLLVDMIEEDFRRETIPHVNVVDRKALIRRQLDRHYRDEDYVHAKVIGRNKTGRKDDTVLLSALTNTGLLAPWLDRLSEHSVRLAGIWSLPLLTEKLLRSLINDDENALIVSRQIRSALRNSYFRNGKMLLSRQAKFDRAMWDNEHFGGVISNLQKGSVEIYNFLINQRIMDTSDHLNVYCILGDDQLDEARQLSQSTSTIHYAFISLEQLFKQFGIQGCEKYGADALFAYLCMKSNSLSDHYARQEQKSTYYRYLLDKMITQVAEIGSLICITAAVLLSLKTLELSQAEESVARDSAYLEYQYSDRYGEIESQLNTATMVRDAVSLFAELEVDAKQSPQQYFGTLSQVLGQAQFRPISLEQIQWQKYSPLELDGIVEAHRAQLAQENSPDLEDVNSYDEVEAESESTSPKQRSTLKLVGRIDTTGYSYRTTISRMKNFVRELEKSPNVENVLLIKTAVDVRDTSRFTDQIGDLSMQPSTNIDSNLFEILVVLEDSPRA